MPHAAQTQMGAQGDGNHCLFIGRSRATGRVAMVTHHGSRGLGRLLCKEARAVAEQVREARTPETRRQNARIPADTEEGQNYGAALQISRSWTKAHHNARNQAVVEQLRARPWDSHRNGPNFTLRRGDLFLSR
ncbi:RtcB family protein [Phaeovulum sp. W22_SRMD_FR3]|uniref:RtcB family protein n=1 Tax=Phaeovulum sp. W22_SRMD_FR3 TaxID=3240274 RepID=UPI003F9A506B